MKLAVMTANSDDFDPRPLPINMAPLPTQRTSSPTMDTFLEPLLMLTPDKPKGLIPRVASGNTKSQSERPVHRTDRSPNRQSEDYTSRMDRAENGQSSGKGKTSPVIASNPGVLFQQQRTNQKAVVQKQLKIIRHGGSGPQKEPPKVSASRSKENKVTAKFDKLTRPSKALKNAKTSSNCDPKSAISKANGEPGHGRSQKHVRIVDPKSALSAPELHSTAALGHQLTELKAQTFDPEEVVMKTLQESQSTRLALSEKVAEAANLGKNEKKYSGLVSLGVPVDELLQRAIAQKTALVKKRPAKSSKPSELPPPDVLDMFTPSMIVESANLNASGLGPPKVTPAPVDQDMTFDLYRHMQCWDLGV